MPGVGLRRWGFRRRTCGHMFEGSSWELKEIHAEVGVLC
jgi:hypothetical protein